MPRLTQLVDILFPTEVHQVFVSVHTKSGERRLWGCYGAFVQNLLKIHLKSITFQPVLSLINHTHTQATDKRIITKSRQRSKSIWNNNAQIYSFRLSDLFGKTRTQPLEY